MRHFHAYQHVQLSATFCKKALVDRNCCCMSRAGMPQLLSPGSVKNSPSVWLLPSLTMTICLTKSGQAFQMPKICPPSWGMQLLRYSRRASLCFARSRCWLPDQCQARCSSQIGQQSNRYFAYSACPNAEEASFHAAGDMFILPRTIEQCTADGFFGSYQKSRPSPPSPPEASRFALSPACLSFAPLSSYQTQMSWMECHQWIFVKAQGLAISLMPTPNLQGRAMRCLP